MYIVSFAVTDREQQALAAISEQFNKHRRAAGKPTSSDLAQVAKAVFVAGLQAVKEKELASGN